MRLRQLRHLRRIAALALLALACAACQTPRHIRAAQSAFNDAAIAENADRVAAADSSPLLASGATAASGYQVALGLVERELAEHEEKLSQEDLLGTALMLRVLCLWRLADLDSDPQLAQRFDAAISDLAARASQPGVTLGPRDAALLAALPGLRDHDRGLAQASYADASRYFESAYVVYGDALRQGTLPANHPLRTYLLLSKLATLRAWKYSAFTLPAGAERDAVEKQLVDCGRSVAADLQPASRENPQLGALVTDYAKRIGFSPTSLEGATCSIN